MPNEHLRENTLIVCEGPTDTAAILDLGFDAIGRPSCHGCEDYVRDLARGKDMVILADDDGPGRDGAIQLAKAIRWKSNSTKIISPHNGCNDAREWAKKKTTTRRYLEIVIQNASPV